MTRNDLNFVPHSDMEIDDLETVTRYNSLIKSGRYEDAQKLLLDKGYKKGFVASFLNYLQDKLRQIQIAVLNKNAAPDEYYSLNEPSEEQMQGKTFWIQPIND